MLGDWHEAQDLTQDVFFKASQRPRRSCAVKLYRIAVNLCLNHQRRRKRARWLSLDWLSEQGGDEQAAGIPTVEDAGHGAGTAGKGGLVQAAIRSLPEKQRVALVLSVYERLSYQEIATVMGCSLAFGGIAAAPGQGNLTKAL